MERFDPTRWLAEMRGADPALLLTQESHVYLFPLRCAQAEVEQLRSLLDGEERRRAARFVRPRHQAEYIVAHGTLRLLLSLYTGMPPAALAFECGPHGKPALHPDLRSSLRFNLAHAAGLGLVGLASSREIGVDLEEIRPLETGDMSAPGIWTPDERRQLEALNPQERLEAFYVGWVRKEACVKALGVGLADGAQHLEVSLRMSDIGPPRQINADFSREWSLWTFQQSPRVLGAVAVLDLHGRHTKAKLVQFDHSPAELIELHRCFEPIRQTISRV